MSVAPLDPTARAAAAAQISRALNIRPLYDLLKQKIPEAAPLSFNVPFAVVDSNAFISTSLVSLKNAPYAIAGNELNIADWSNFISTRVRYVESALFSAVSLVHNVVFATVFSVLAVVSFGQISKMNNLAIKHLIQTALGVGSFVVSVIGAVVPKFGILTNLALAGGVGVVFLQHTENELAAAINDFYQKNKAPLRSALLSSVGNNQGLFDAQINPMLQHIERQLAGDRVRPLGGLVQVFIDAYKNYAATGVLATALAARGLEEVTGGDGDSGSLRPLLDAVSGLLPST